MRLGILALGPGQYARILRRAAGIGLAIGGLLTLFLAGRNANEILGQIPDASAAGQMGTIMGNLGLGVAFGGVSVASVYAGAQVTREAPVKTWLLLVSLIPQVLSVVVSGFQYRFSPAGFIGLGAYSVGEIVRVGLLFQTGSQMYVGFDSMDEWVVQLNFGALLLGALILVRPKPKADKTGPVVVSGCAENS